MEQQQTAYFEYLGDIFEKHGFKITVESNNGKKLNRKKLEDLCLEILGSLLRESIKKPIK